MSYKSKPTRRQLQILSIVWEMGEATVRDVYERMREEERIAQNTVQTMLRVMDEKGLVKHRVVGRAFLYRCAYSREQSLRTFLDDVFQGAATELVASLLRTRKLSKGEIDEIDAMIQDLRKKR